ncbi:MAG: type I methionyl aminopeptidase [Thermoanaerobaculia bacterium]
MSIEKPEDLERLRAIGRIVGLTIQEVRKYVRPGVTTAELDAIGDRFLTAHGAHPAPRQTYNFPGAIMICVNDEAVHSVPGERRIEAGDLVKIDITAERDGYYADAAITVAVPPVENLQHNIIQAAQSAFRKGARAARAGNRVNDIGRAVETEVRRRGFTVLRELSGHGVGRSIHEEPQVPNVYDPRSSRPLTEGLVLTIEPIIAAGASHVKVDGDKWTTRTVDGSLAAHYEHTLVITRDRPILVTQVAE